MQCQVPEKCSTKWTWENQNLALGWCKNKSFFYVSPNKEVATKWCWDICRWFISHQLFLYWSLVPLVEEQISRWYYCSNFFCTSTNLSQLQIVCERYKIFLFPPTTLGIFIQPNERCQMKWEIVYECMCSIFYVKCLMMYFRTFNEV